MRPIHLISILLLTFSPISAQDNLSDIRNFLRLSPRLTTSGALRENDPQRLAAHLRVEGPQPGRQREEHQRAD